MDRIVAHEIEIRYKEEKKWNNFKAFSYRFSTQA